eukprot:6193093-Pleurochrysis_carterae.AAC.2
MGNRRPRACLHTEKRAGLDCMAAATAAAAAAAAAAWHHVHCHLPSTVAHHGLHCAVSTSPPSTPWSEVHGDPRLATKPGTVLSLITFATAPTFAAAQLSVSACTSVPALTPMPKPALAPVSAVVPAVVPAPIDAPAAGPVP